MENNPAPKSFKAGSVIRSLENPSFRYRLNVVESDRAYTNRPGVMAKYTVISDGYTSSLSGFFPYAEYVEELPEAETFQQALARFLAAAQANIDAYFAANYTRLKPPTLKVDEGGQKYLRVVQHDADGPSRSAWAFVEVATGNILKCEGWKRPAKGVRGSIYAKDFAGYGCGHNGPKYLR